MFASAALRWQPVNHYSPQRLADGHFSWARAASQRGDYDSALLWARSSEAEMPQARTHALLAQIFLAQANFRDAAQGCAQAVAMGPLMDWQTVYGFYGFAMPRFTRQLDALKKFVAENPSSADGHFLLGYEQLALGQAQAGHAQGQLLVSQQKMHVGPDRILGDELFQGICLVNLGMAKP